MVEHKPAAPRFAGNLLVLKKLLKFEEIDQIEEIVLKLINLIKFEKFFKSNKLLPVGCT